MNLLARAEDVPQDRLERSRRWTQPTGPDQHSVHVRHHRPAERRDAVASQHPSQRVLCGRVPEARSHGPNLSACAAVPLLRLRAGNAVLRGSRLGDGVSGRMLRTRRDAGGDRTANAARRSTACRRCLSRMLEHEDYPTARPFVAADRNHGRQPVSDRDDEARDAGNGGAAKSRSAMDRPRRRR